MIDDIFIEGLVSPRGAMRPSDLQTLKLSLVRFAGERIIVRVQKWTARRSLAANNYYWGVIVKSISEYTGYHKDEVHEILRAKFAMDTRWIVNEKNGEVTEVACPASTATMTKAEFALFVDRCAAFAFELGCEIPTEYEGDRYAYAEDH